MLITSTTCIRWFATVCYNFTTKVKGVLEVSIHLLHLNASGATSNKGARIGTPDYGSFFEDITPSSRETHSGQDKHWPNNNGSGGFHPVLYRMEDCQTVGRHSSER